MKGPTVYFYIFTTAVLLGLAYLTLILVRRVFPVYRRRAVGRCYWLCTLASLAVLAIARHNFAPLPTPLIQWGVMWLIGQLALLFLTPLFYGLVKAAAGWLPEPAAGRENAAGRRLLLRSAAVLLPASSFGLSTYGVFVNSGAIETLRYTVALERLPPALRGFTIAQISDAHIGTFFSVRRLEEVLRRIAREKPDVLVITGDLIDDVEQTEAIVAKLAEFAPQFPRGVFFCWGNHEYFRDVGRIRRALEKSPVRTLRNAASRLADGERPLYFLGVDYPWAETGAEQRAKRAAMMAAALRGVPDDAVRVLLTHHPDFIDDAYGAGIDLTLAGHTHGGQVACCGRSLLPVRYKYMLGMYRSGPYHAYVSAGAGSWFPFRLGCPPEIGVFKLTGA